MPLFTFDQRIRPRTFVGECDSTELRELKEAVIEQCSADEIVKDCLPDVEDDLFNILKSERSSYNYADMYVDHLKGEFDLKKFIESFGRSTLLKAMGDMV